MPATGLPEKLELFLLGLLLFALPTMESPKTIALVLYLVVWTARRFSLAALRQFRPHAIEMCLLAMLAASAASTAFNWPFPNGAKGFSDTLRYVLLFWFIYRAGYSAAQHLTLARATTAGLVLGLALATFELATGRRALFELHSAGILTQSAIYIAVVFVLAFGILLVRWLPRGTPPTSQPPLWPWTLSLAAMLLALMVMGSRGALLALALAVFLIAVSVNRAKLWAALALGAVLATAAGFGMLKSGAGGDVLANIQTRFSSERMLHSNREHYENIRVALAQARQGDSLWLGIGPRNYRSIDLARLSFDPPLQLPGAQGKLNHAHNLFLTKLVEEGLFGLAAFLSLIGVVLYQLFTAWRGGRWYDWRWFTALGALTIPIVGGMVNTPFYQEHAMLAMALMAIFLGSRRTPGPRGAAG